MKSEASTNTYWWFTLKYVSCWTYMMKWNIRHALSRKVAKGMHTSDKMGYSFQENNVYTSFWSTTHQIHMWIQAKLSPFKKCHNCQKNLKRKKREASVCIIDNERHTKANGKGKLVNTVCHNQVTKCSWNPWDYLMWYDRARDSNEISEGIYSLFSFSLRASLIELKKEGIKCRRVLWLFW